MFPEIEVPTTTSARNVLPGLVTAIEPGAVTSHLRIDRGGRVVTASITNAAVDELGPAVGEPACAVIRASDVTVGKD